MSNRYTTIRTFWRLALVFGVSVLTALGLLVQVPLTRAALDVPQVLTYQARLTDSSRITVDDGSLSMQFTFYDALVAGSCVYVAGGTCGVPSTVSVSTTDGIFTVPLGDGVLTNAFGDELFDDNPALYLEVQIAGETLTPRRQLTSSAYAMQAGDSDLLDSLNSDNDGCTAGCIVAANANGNVVVTGDPQSSLASGSSLYINPASPAADEAIFGVANGGSAIFTLDEDGDITRIGSTSITDTVDQTSFTLTNNASGANDVLVLSATGLTSGDALQITTGAGDSAINVAVGNVTFNDNLTVTGLTMLDGTSSTPDTVAGDGDLFVDDGLEVDGLLDADGSVDLGDASGDTITATGRFDSNLIPSADATYDLGNDDLRWSDLYVSGSTIRMGATGTQSSGGSVGNAGSDASISYSSDTLFFETDNGYSFDVDDDATEEIVFGAGGSATLDINETTSTQGAGALQGFNPAVTNTSSTANSSYNTYQEFTRSGYSTGTVVNAGIFQDVNNAASAGDAVVTNYGIDIDLDDTSGAGTTVTNYGIRAIVDTSGGSGTYTNYAIFTGGGIVHIDDDATPAVPDIATSAGELFVNGDIESDGNIRVDGTGASSIAGTLAVAGHVGLGGASVVTTDTLIVSDTYDSISDGSVTRNGVGMTMTFSNNTVTSGTHLYNGYKTSVTASGIDNDTTVSGIRASVVLSGTAPVALNDENIYGSSVNVDVLDSTSKFAKGILYDGSSTYTGGSTSAGWVGSRNILTVNSGVISDARGFEGTVTVDTGSVTTAYGASLVIQDIGAGSITDAIGLSISADGATSDDIALYVAKGAVHIDDAAFSGSPATAATFGDGAGGNPDIGDDGTLYVKSGIEIGNGSLCVGGATSCASASATTTGQIYADGSILANDFDLAEMFESNDYLLAGEIVTIDLNTREKVKRAQPGDIILGAISTTPGLVLGWGGINQYPVALAGRVPVMVSDENGPIRIGDRVTLGNTPGVGMKATQAGEILGIAMQASSGLPNDAITLFIQPQYWNGNPDVVSVTQRTPSPIIQTNNVLVVSDNVISNIASLHGMNWSVNADGVFATEGTYDLVTMGHQNRNVVTHAVTGMENYVTMAGTTSLTGDMAIISFEDIDPEFNDVIEAGASIFVNATMSNGSGNVYVTDKSMNGFTLNRERGTGTEIDWVVTAFRKGFAPAEDEVADPELVEPPETDTDDTVTETLQDDTVEQDEATIQVVEEEVVPELVVEEVAEQPVEEDLLEETVIEVEEEVVPDFVAEESEIVSD